MRPGRWLTLFLLLLGPLAAPPAQGAVSVATPHATVTLLSEPSPVAPGQTR